MDIFKIVSYAGYLHCDSAVKVAFPVVQLVFVLVQVKNSRTYIIVKINKLFTSIFMAVKYHNYKFADILLVDSCQGLCAATKELHTVGYL